MDKNMYMLITEKQLLVNAKRVEGIPTPELIDNNLSLADINNQNMIDNTMYAVVHTALGKNWNAHL